MALKPGEKRESDQPPFEAGAEALTLAQSHVPVVPQVLHDAQEYAGKHLVHPNRVAGQIQATQSLAGRST